MCKFYKRAIVFNYITFLFNNYIQWTNNKCNQSLTYNPDRPDLAICSGNRPHDCNTVDLSSSKTVQRPGSATTPISQTHNNSKSFLYASQNVLFASMAFDHDQSGDQHHCTHFQYGHCGDAVFGPPLPFVRWHKRTRSTLSNTKTGCRIGFYFPRRNGSFSETLCRFVNHIVFIFGTTWNCWSATRWMKTK